MTSYIYFLQANGDGPIKIGFTTNDPVRRKTMLQTGCPWPVKLIGAIEGTESQEKQIHLLLSRWKTSGEWFESHPIVLAAINEALSVGNRVVIEGRKTKKISHPLKLWRLGRSITQDQLGELLGVDKMSISRWERGKIVPHRSQWGNITQVTGVSIEQLVGAAQ